MIIFSHTLNFFSQPPPPLHFTLSLYPPLSHSVHHSRIPSFISHAQSLNILSLSPPLSLLLSLILSTSVSLSHFISLLFFLSLTLSLSERLSLNLCLSVSLPLSLQLIFFLYSPLLFLPFDLNLFRIKKKL